MTKVVYYAPHFILQIINDQDLTCHLHKRRYSTERYNTIAIQARFILGIQSNSINMEYEKYCPGSKRIFLKGTIVEMHFRF